MCIYIYYVYIYICILYRYLRNTYAFFAILFWVICSCKSAQLCQALFSSITGYSEMEVDALSSVLWIFLHPSASWTACDWESQWHCGTEVSGLLAKTYYSIFCYAQVWDLLFCLVFFASAKSNWCFHGTVSARDLQIRMSRTPRQTSWQWVQQWLRDSECGRWTPLRPQHRTARHRHGKITIHQNISYHAKTLKYIHLE